MRRPALAEFASRLADVRVRHPWGVPDGEWSVVNGAGRVWEIPVDAVDDRGKTAVPGAFRYATPHSFKGLEADVVLLIDVDGDVDPCRPGGRGT